MTEVMLDPNPNPKEQAINAAEAKLAKEARDVRKTMVGVEATMKGILDKETKMLHASTPKLKKQYKKQIKSSKTYLKSLFTSLEQEMWEHAEAECALDRLEDLNNG